MANKGIARGDDLHPHAVRLAPFLTLFSMKRLFGSLVVVAASAAFMFPIFPLSNQWCANGPYSVVRPNGLNVPQTLTFVNQSSFCGVLAGYQALLVK